MNDPAMFRRLVRQIERDRLVQRSLRTLLSAADAALAWRRRDLRNLKARMRDRPRA